MSAVKRPFEVVGFAVLSTLLAGFAAPAAGQEFAAGLGAGTTGLEAHAAVNLGSRVTFRATGNFLDFESGQTFDGIDYDARLDASTAAGFVDLMPFANAFTVTGGVYVGGREASLTGTPTGPVEIGDTTFTPAEVGSLVGSVDLGEFAPFVGFGYDNTFTSNGPLGLRLSLGVAVGEEPTVTLQSVGGTLSGDPTLQAELAEESANISEDADMLRYYPVVSTGLSWRF